MVPDNVQSACGKVRPLLTDWGVFESGASSRELLFLALASLFIRTFVLILLPSGLHKDPDMYRHLAENLLITGQFGFGGIPTAFRPPLYAVLLVPCALTDRGWWWAVAALHLTLGVATVILTYFLGRMWGLGRWAWVAGFLVGCDPILMHQSTQVMTETLATMLTAATLLAIGRWGLHPSGWSAFCLGGFLALAVLARANLLPWAILVVVLVPWVGAYRFTGGQSTEPGVGDNPVSKRPRCTDANESRVAAVLTCFTAAALGLLVVAAPWWVRNWLVFGRPILATTHGGFTFFLANNDEFYDFLFGGTSPDILVWNADQFNDNWVSQHPRNVPQDELVNDREAYRAAWLVISARPWDFVRSCFIRMGWFWAILPHQLSPEEGGMIRIAKWGVAAFYAVEFFLAILGFWVIWRSVARSGSMFPPGLWAGLLLAVVLTGVHAVYWSNMRMRSPLVPTIALLATMGLRMALVVSWPKVCAFCSSSSRK